MAVWVEMVASDNWNTICSIRVMVVVSCIPHKPVVVSNWTVSSRIEMVLVSCWSGSGSGGSSDGEISSSRGTSITCSSAGGGISTDEISSSRGCSCSSTGC